MIVWFVSSLASYRSSSSCGRKSAWAMIAVGECSSRTSESRELDVKVNEGIEWELSAKSEIKYSIHSSQKVCNKDLSTCLTQSVI